MELLERSQTYSSNGLSFRIGVRATVCKTLLRRANGSDDWVLRFVIPRSCAHWREIWPSCGCHNSKLGGRPISRLGRRGVKLRHNRVS